jgi:hypothetical protein
MDRRFLGSGRSKSEPLICAEYLACLIRFAPWQILQERGQNTRSCAFGTEDLMASSV